MKGRLVSSSLRILATSLAGFLLISCGPALPKIRNIPNKPANSLSGILDIRSRSFHGKVEAMVAILIPDRLRFEIMSGNRTEALIILNGERASCAFPPDHLIYISSAAMLTNDFLGTEIKSRDLAFLLSGQINGLVDWVKTAHELNRGDVRVVLSRVHAQTGLPLVIELINHSQYARLSWRQVTFDSDPEEVAFEPPAGYDPCERPAFLEKIGR